MKYRLHVFVVTSMPAGGNSPNGKATVEVFTRNGLINANSAPIERQRLHLVGLAYAASHKVVRVGHHITADGKSTDLIVGSMVDLSARFKGVDIDREEGNLRALFHEEGYSRRGTHEIPIQDLEAGRVWLDPIRETIVYDM